jgi:hypothetical protein
MRFDTLLASSRGRRRTEGEERPAGVATRSVSGAPLRNLESSFLLGAGAVAARRGNG